MSSRDDMEALKQAAQQPPQPLKPRFEITRDGVNYIGTKIDPQTGEASELPAVWLSDRLEIIGRGVDDAGIHYRVLRWNSRGDQQTQTMALPLAGIGEREAWGTLRSRGMALAPSRRALEHLALYLQTQGSDAMHRITERGGWCDGAYILPSGEVIGTPATPVYYAGDKSNASAYLVAGTAATWRDNVARLARGNSRPMLAIGIALAAPLLHLVELESGGFHLFGPSGCGKSTSANIGASVWGKPREQVLNWDATALALANAAAARNDGLMLLDEMGQGNPDAVSMAAYRLFNGTGKMQGHKDGGNRDMLRWRVLVLSTGEIDLAGFMNGGGRRTRAGQEVRLASLPADAGKGLGAFETLQGYADGDRLAKALEEAARAHHGSVGRAFVEHVANHHDAITARLHAAINIMRDRLPKEATGQVRRVAARFAVVAEALEIATDAGLTGWDHEDGRKAVLRCFDDWLHRYGVGNREETQIIEQAEAFFAAHAFGRFIDCAKAADPNGEPVMVNCAGYRKRDPDGLHWLVFPAVFVGEIAEGFDKTAAADVLAKAGMLQKGNDGKATTKAKTPDVPKATRRFYRFVRINCEADEG